MKNSETLLFSRIAPADAELPVTRGMEGAADYLTDSEILSVLLRQASPTASLDAGRSLLNMFGGLKELARLPASQIMAVSGVGKRNSCTLERDSIRDSASG